MALRVVFMGTPDFARGALMEIVARGHEVIAVYTQMPRPAGRGQAERKSPVHRAAEGLGIPVLTPKDFRDKADRDAFAAHKADVAVVVAYGLLLPKEVLGAPRYGCLNLHGSLLPRWRGAAPIQRALMEGDVRTGVMVMKMDEGLDTGPIALAEEIPIGPDMTAGELHDEMMRTGADLIGRALAALERGSLAFTPQPDAGATYARKIEKSMTGIDFSGSAEQVHNLVRGLSPFPGAWFEIELQGKPARIKVLRSSIAEGQGRPGLVLDDRLTIACGSGAVRLLTVQREGRAAMDVESFLRGTGDLKGKMVR